MINIDVHVRGGCRIFKEDLTLENFRKFLKIGPMNFPEEGGHLTKISKNTLKRSASPKKEDPAEKGGPRDTFRQKGVWTGMSLEISEFDTPYPSPVSVIIITRRYNYDDAGVFQTWEFI